MYGRRDRLRHRLRALVRAERGAAAVEFALVTLVLLALVLGVMDVGRLL